MSIEVVNSHCIVVDTETYFGNHERLDFACVGDMGSHAQINHRATAINCCRCPIRYFRFDKILLVFVVLARGLE